MFIITVIPTAKGISKDTLTYFSKEEITKGSFVSIPIRKRTVYGLVVETKLASSLKTEIKNLSYSIKKIEKKLTRKILPLSYIKSLEVLSEYYATSIGAVLYNFLPDYILDSKTNIETEEIVDTNNHETLLLQSNSEERYATYKSLIREEFARGKSVLFCLPSIEDIKNTKNILEKGIEKYTIAIHSQIEEKELKNIWQTIAEEKHPMLIICTGSSLFIPKQNISTIILEKESSRLYKMQNRPFLDIRKVAEVLTKNSGKKLILGDIFLKTETLWQEKNGRYSSLSPLKFRSLSPANCQKINMQSPKDMQKKDFKIISDELKNVLTKAEENNERTFLFCSRKGLYPETICSDCGAIVVCENCKAPVVLYGKKNQTRDTSNLFVCHHCGERREADILCKKCGGWRLSTFGIGTEKVYEEIKKMFPNSLVQILDKENTKTQKQAIKTRDNFYNNPKSILIGTEMSIPYLNKEIENTATVSVDAFFSIPDFRISEKIFHIILEMRELTQKNMILQTRQIDKNLFDYALKGNLVDFYRDELEERKELNYPPFSLFIKLTIEGSRVAIKKQMEQIVEYMRPYEVSVFEAFSPKKTGTYTVHGLITLSQEMWVDKELVKKLKQLPPFVMVKIDPDTLL